MKKNEMETITAKESSVVLKSFGLDYSKIKTVEDVVVVLKAMNFTWHWFEGNCPEEYKEILEKGFLIECK